METCPASRVLVRMVAQRGLVAATKTTKTKTRLQ